MEIFKLGEAHLAYWATGSGRPVLFIHGVATLGELWAADLAPLASDCRIIAYDRRGYGSSSGSPGSWETHADDAIALIEGLNAAPAVVIGYSAGSIIALDLALRRPDLLSGIVLLDPAFNLRRCMTPRFLATFAMVQLSRRMGRDRAAVERWLRYVSSYSTGGSAYDKKTPPERREMLLRNAAGIFADFDSGGGSVDESRLASVSVPITLVELKLSPPFLRRSCQRLKELLPQARSRAIEHSGHWAGLDAREELLSILRESVRTAPGD
jgi:pimeloyl-ACP methyl ester carboxylesterase